MTDRSASEQSGNDVAYEVAVYTAEEPERLAVQHLDVHAQLAGYDGYLTSLALRAVDDQSLFADVVVWRDLAAGQAAADTMVADPALSWFREQIREIRLFAHFSGVEMAPEALTRIATAPVVELAVYRPAAPRRHGPVHRLVHSSSLPAREGVVANVGLVGGENGLVADLVGWSSPTAMAETELALAGSADLAGFFTPPAQTAVSGVFTAASSHRTAR